MSVDYITYYADEPGIPVSLKEACEWADESIFKDALGKQPLPESLSDTTIILAGGALRSFFLNQSVRDYDLYCSDISPIQTCLGRIGYAQIHETDRSQTWRKRAMYAAKAGPQPTKFANLIKKKYDVAHAVLDDFDFTVCMCAITRMDDALSITYHPEYFMDLAARRLVVHQPDDPLNTLWRVQKYIKLGFSIDRPNLWKIIEDIHNLSSLPKIGYPGEETLVIGETTQTLEDIMGGS